MHLTWVLEVFFFRGDGIVPRSRQSVSRRGEKKLQKILLKYFSPMVTENTSGIQGKVRDLT